MAPLANSATRRSVSPTVKSPTDTRQRVSPTKTSETVSSTNTPEAVLAEAFCGSDRSDKGWLLRKWEPRSPVTQGGGDFRYSKNNSAVK
jgi:hypothetical protein